MKDKPNHSRRCLVAIFCGLFSASLWAAEQKILRKNGYQTAMIGKIHLAGNMQGFENQRKKKP